MTVKTGKIGTAIVGSDHVGWVSVYIKFKVTIKNSKILLKLITS